MTVQVPRFLRVRRTARIANVRLSLVSWLVIAGSIGVMALFMYAGRGLNSALLMVVPSIALTILAVEVRWRGRSPIALVTMALRFALRSHTWRRPPRVRRR
jgi:hypothetical protein